MPWKEIKQEKCHRCGRPRTEVYSTPAAPDKPKPGCRVCATELRQKAHAEKGGTTKSAPKKNQSNGTKKSGGVRVRRQKPTAV
jgi:hypothetical protein